MFNFRNDYHDLAHPEVLKRLLQLEEEGNKGYGFDPHTERAQALIGEAVETPLPVYFVPGGTAANTLAIAFHLRPHEAVVSAESGHIVGDEVGAVESGGHKIVTVPTETGKLSAEALEEELARYGSFHNVLPGMIYLSNATETGRVYTKRELAEIREVADRYELLVYIDGARMGAALASEASDLTLSDYPRYADIFSIGGTKNGALFGEALVFSNPTLGDEFLYFQKQQSLLLAKGFLLGAQFEALFEGNLFLEIASAANAAAKKLDRRLREIGIHPIHPVESNQLFLRVRKKTCAALESAGEFEVVGGEEPVIRLVTTYATRDEEIDEFVAILREQLNS